jgi:hypothetical protein
MSERFEVHGNNDTTSTLIAKKYTLTGALIFAIEIADTWDDIHIRHYASEDADQFKMVAKLALKGMFV